MLAFLVSLLFGILVGMACALVGVKSPAPPIVALFGLLGIGIDEQGVIWPTPAAPHRTIGQHDTGQPKGSVEAPPGTLTEE